MFNFTSGTCLLTLYFTYEGDYSTSRYTLYQSRFFLRRNCYWIQDEKLGMLQVFCSLSINWTEHMVRLWWQMHFTTSMSVLPRFDTFIVTYKVPQDIVAYTIALLAAYVQEKKYRPSGFTYALHRAELVGAFFNGVFLLALALSIFLQSIERFVNIEPMKDPRSMLVVGCVGLGLNLLSAGIVHGEDLGLFCSYALFTTWMASRTS